MIWLLLDSFAVPSDMMYLILECERYGYRSLTEWNTAHYVVKYISIIDPQESMYVTILME